MHNQWNSDNKTFPWFAQICYERVSVPKLADKLTRVVLVSDHRKLSHPRFVETHRKLQTIGNDSRNSELDFHYVHFPRYVFSHTCFGCEFRDGTTYDTCRRESSKSPDLYEMRKRRCLLPVWLLIRGFMGELSFTFADRFARNCRLRF